MITALIWAGALLAATATVAVGALRAWRGWLELKRYQLALEHGAGENPELTPTVRIEMAAMRERLRKLEAIATGVDL
jgi:hypothetical protein